MEQMNSRAMLALGLILVLLGAGLPFLMVMQIIPPSFLPGFFSYAASVAGLFLGLIGTAWFTAERR